MVCSGEEEEREEELRRSENMETGTTSLQGGGGEGGDQERPFKAPLHNFNLPSLLKWGHQRHLRCIKLPADRKRRTSEDGIEAVRERIMSDLKTAAEKMKDAIFNKEVASFDEEEVAGRWNLRTRRGVVGKGVSPAPVVVAGVAAGGRRVVVFGGGVEEVEEEKKREKFAVGLRRKEIEDDFWEMVGHRPARRPKKRPRNVQRQLDMLFPGLWLTEVTVDTYKVPEVPDNGKR